MNVKPLKTRSLQNNQTNKISEVVSKIKDFKHTTAVIIVLQIVIIALLAYGIFVPKQTLGAKLVDEVANIAGINTSNFPIEIIELDKQLLDQLNTGNSIQEEVYKDAEVGDYILVYSDRMIIYRRSEKEVIYDGLSPSQISQTEEATVINTIVSLAKQQGIIPSESESVPQASVVTDPTAFKQQDPEFYADLAQGHVIAVFPNEQVIVLYNPTNTTIYKRGNVSTVIQ
jgi:hypothetical protein